MLNSIFSGLFENGKSLDLTGFLLCLLCALLLGCILALVFRRQTASNSLTLTLSILPAVVCIVILMVNGNLGAGVAVAGAFSLVRFRSAPGTAREICALFLAMAVGLACGMGYLGFALLFCVVMIPAWLGLNALCNEKHNPPAKRLRITIPEDLDYTGVFDDILIKYTHDFQLLGVKTSNLGSLYKISYQINLKDAALEKQMIDELRCRNGNLEISCSFQPEDNRAL